MRDEFAAFLLAAAPFAASPAAAVAFAVFTLPATGAWQIFEVRVPGAVLVDAMVQAENRYGASWWENLGDDESNWAIWGNAYEQFDACGASTCGSFGYLRDVSLTPQRLRVTYRLPREHQNCPTAPRIAFAVRGERWFDPRVSGTVAIEGAGVPAVTLVPEPAAWATMIVGFAAAGAALRRRRQATVTA